MNGVHDMGGMHGMGPIQSRRVNLRVEKYRRRLASRWGIVYVPATSIRLGTHACRATRAARLA